MYKKISMLLLGAFALSTLPALADTGSNIIIDPVTKKIIVVTDTGNVTADDPMPTTGNTTENTTTGSNFVENFVQTGSNATGSNTTGTNQTHTTTGTNTTSSTPAPTDEFGQALEWMYTNGMTKYNNATDFRASDGLTRQEAAKIIGQAYVVL